MTSVDRIIGRLEALAESHKEFREEMRAELAEIKKDVKSLNEFKWKWAGGFAVVLAVMNAGAWLVGVLFASGR